MKFRHQLFILLIFFGTSVYLFYAGYDTVKKELIRDLNVRQMSHAKQAAKGIESFFNHYLSDLKFLSQIDSIIDMDDRGRDLMRIFQSNNSDEINGVTRVDADGRIMSSFPYDQKSIGVDISSQDHMREIMKTHQPVVSDVFEAVQGFRCIAFHVPVFRGESYAGSIAILIPFDHISKKFLEDIRIGSDGYAWLLSPKGVELYCPVPGHIGKTVYETSSRFPSVLSMADEMTQGKRGETTYIYDRIRGNTIDTITKQAVYLPIPVINTFWSIVVATPEDEVLNAMEAFNHNWIRIILVMASGCIVFACALLKAREMTLEHDRRKKSEAALVFANRNLNDIIEFLPDATLVIDKEKKIVAWNRAMEEMTGVAKEDMIGKAGYAQTIPFYGEPRPHLLDLIDTRDEELESRYKNVKKRGRVLTAEAFAPALYGGKGAHIWMTGAPLFDIHGNPSGAIESIRDITERKLAENALKQSEEKYRELVENVNSIIFRRDPSGNILFFNEFAQIFFGYKEAEIIGRNVVGTIVPETESTGRNLKWLIEDIGRNPDSYTNNVNENMRRNGDRVWIAWTNKPVYDDNHQIREILCIGNDITERMQIEADRQKLELRLSRAEKMESLGTLAGGVAHDLNNVLGVLVGYSELLKENIPESSPLRKFVDNIMLSGMRGAAIIQDLLTLARRGVPVSQVVNLNRVLSAFFETPEFEKLKAAHPGVTFNIHLEKSLLNITGSPVHLEKTVMNLVANAAESVSGAGQVKIQTENQYLESPIRGYDEVQKGDYVVLTVSDTGGGIPDKDIGKIFEPFYTKKVMGKSGTGLGLAVVWGTVKDHRGYINVQSEDGKGTVFTLYFPITRENLIEDKKPLALDVYQGRGESVLVVDDIKEQRELVLDMLTRLGYRVTALPSGEAALEYLKTHTADLVVLDMIMEPGMDGLETYQRILELNPRQKAVIVSGYSETDRVKTALDLGAGAYVKKPYVMEKIGMVIRKQLDS
jgi:PAS domain S-box-containing protein